MIILSFVTQEYIDQNSCIICHPNQIHAMGDSGNNPSSLITLHAYSNSIPFMMVYDDKNSKRFKLMGVVVTGYLTTKHRSSRPSKDLFIIRIENYNLVSFTQQSLLQHETQWYYQHNSLNFFSMCTSHINRVLQSISPS